MKKFPKPWYRPSRGVWYVTIRGKQHPLGADKDAAFRQYHELMGRPRAAGPIQVQAESVLAIVDKFLDWCQEHRASATYEWYFRHLQSFAESIDRSLTVSELRPYHIDEWLAKRPDWSGGTKHGACRAIQRAMRWAEKKGRIEKSPVADYEKPRPGKRNVVISPPLFETILGCVKCEPFRDLLVTTWETAARPQESLAVEARHVDLSNKRWIFPPDESKGEQFPRIVYLTPTALKITKRLMLKHPEGPLFRNTEGRSWSTDAVNCAFIRIQISLGEQVMKDKGIMVDSALSKAQAKQQAKNLALEHGKKYCLYHLRHSWLDRALKSGVDALTCAILMGHRDPSTLAKVYQHLSQSPDYLLQAAKKATG